MRTACSPHLQYLSLGMDRIIMGPFTPPASSEISGLQRGTVGSIIVSSMDDPGADVKYICFWSISLYGASSHVCIYDTMDP